MREAAMEIVEDGTFIAPDRRDSGQNLTTG
jgi:hypothetical protein